MVLYARYHPGGYECSSKGDKRFSALFAVLPDGRTIEEAYQLDVKGYREITNDWRVGKGCTALNGKMPVELYEEYKGLWKIWADANPEIFFELCCIAEKQPLTDMFATGPVNQARALAELAHDALTRARFPFEL